MDTTSGSGLVRVPVGYPRTVKGRMAQVYSIRAYVDEGWMTSRFASKLVGVHGATLSRWARAGLVSYRQDEPAGPFRYLRPELLMVAGLRAGNAPLTIKIIRTHVLRKVGR